MSAPLPFHAPHSPPAKLPTEVDCALVQMKQLLRSAEELANNNMLVDAVSKATMSKSSWLRAHKGNIKDAVICLSVQAWEGGRLAFHIAGELQAQWKRHSRAVQM